MKLRFWEGLDMNWVSCWVSYLCIAGRNPYLNPLLLRPHLHHLHLLTSHVYLNARTLIILACISFGSFVNFLLWVTLQFHGFQCPTSTLAIALSLPKLMILIKMFCNNLEEASFTSFETCKCVLRKEFWGVLFYFTMPKAVFYD